MSDVARIAGQWRSAFEGYVPEGPGPDAHLHLAGVDLRYMISWAAGVTEGSLNAQRNAALAELQGVELQRWAFAVPARRHTHGPAVRCRPAGADQRSRSHCRARWQQRTPRFLCSLRNRISGLPDRASSGRRTEPATHLARSARGSCGYIRGARPIRRQRR